MVPGVTRRIRYMPETVKMLEGYGKTLTAKANATLADEDDGYRMSSVKGRPRPQGRHFVSVMAVSTYAKRSDRKHNTLTRLLGEL